MAYEKQTWVDGVTPLDAEHLNHMEQGISQLSEEIASVKIISYTQFGAALDGVSDDTEAAIACHQYANANGCRVEQHSGTLYLKTATEENCPIVKTSCDWSGMTFKVDEHMGKNIIMKVVPDEGVQSHSLTSEEIGELAKGTVQIPFLVDYKNCICHFTTDISIGNRLNKTGSYVYHETVTVDRYGNLLEGELFRAMSDAKAINMEYQSIFQRPVTLEGARIVLDTADDSKIPCILVKRSNTTLKDWTLVIEREVSSDSTEYKGEILKVENCYNVVIEKFSGENFGTFFSQEAEDKSETCYMVYLSGLSRFTMRDCLMIRAWGVVQSQYCKDMIFKDSTLGRIDNHYGCRNYTVNNCTITSSHSTINIGYGDGQFIIDNVRFVKFADPDTVFQNHCILLRGDFCALYSGELVINNITINNYSGQAINLLSGSYSDSFDFGDSAAILPLEFPEVKINNVVYDTDDVTIVNFKVTKDSYAATQNLPIKAKLVSIENVKVKDNTTKHLRLTVHYGYLDQVTQLDHYGVRMRIPWKSNWITNVSGSILAMDSHINNFNGTIGDTLQLENCYVYSDATTWQYVRDMVLHNCHVYVGSNSTVKFNCNHSFRCTSTVFEERVQSTRFEAIQVPDLYYFKDCYCISSKLDDELASKLVDSNTITNSGILLKSENMPTTLPNPNALTFTGAVTGSYDGSVPLSVEIPSGGGGGELTAVLIATIEGDGQSTMIEQSADLSKDGLYAVSVQLDSKLETNNTSNIIWFRVGSSGIYSSSFSFQQDANAANTITRRAGAMFAIVDRKVYNLGNASYNVTGMTNMCESGGTVHANKIMVNSGSNLPIPTGITMKLFAFR